MARPSRPHARPYRIPKMTLFGWLPQPRPRCGPRRRWRDVVCKDLKDINVGEDEWYELASSHRPTWRSLYRDGCDRYRDGCHETNNLVEQARRVVHCTKCNRFFRRESDMKRNQSQSNKELQCAVRARNGSAATGDLQSMSADQQLDQCQELSLFLVPFNGVA